MNTQIRLAQHPQYNAYRQPVRFSVVGSARCNTVQSAHGRLNVKQGKPAVIRVCHNDKIRKHTKIQTA